MGKNGTRLRDAVIGRVRAVLSIIFEKISTRAKFSPDGRDSSPRWSSDQFKPVIVRDLKVWDVATGKIRDSFAHVNEHMGTESFAISPDSRMLAFADNSDRRPMQVRKSWVTFEFGRTYDTALNSDRPVTIELWDVLPRKPIGLMLGVPITLTFLAILLGRKADTRKRSAEVAKRNAKHEGSAAAPRCPVSWRRPPDGVIVGRRTGRSFQLVGSAYLALWPGQDSRGCRTTHGPKRMDCHAVERGRVFSMPGVPWRRPIPLCIFHKIFIYILNTIDAQASFAYSELLRAGNKLSEEGRIANVYSDRSGPSAHVSPLYPLGVTPYLRPSGATRPVPSSPSAWLGRSRSHFTAALLRAWQSATGCQCGSASSRGAARGRAVRVFLRHRPGH